MFDIGKNFIKNLIFAALYIGIYIGITNTGITLAGIESSRIVVEILIKSIWIVPRIETT